MRTGTIRVGPHRTPSRDPEEAVRLLVERGYTALEVNFEGGFWLKEDAAVRLGTLAAKASIALSIHALPPSSATWTEA